MRRIAAMMLMLAMAALLMTARQAAGGAPEGVNMNAIPLPSPRLDSDFSVERALRQRRSVRDFSGEALALPEIGQLLWAAQGITSPEGLRTAPSAGARYPLEALLVAGNVAGLAPGVYAFHPAGHTLTIVAAGDRRARLAAAALNQDWMQAAPAVIVLCAVAQRTTQKYGRRGIQYVYIEAGHAGQNVFLQAQALYLGAAAVGAFDEAGVSRALQLPRDWIPLYLMPVGRPGPR